MKSELDELIEALEEENKLLEASINDNIDNFEYIDAHFQSRALNKLSTRLNILYKMKDSLYTEKMNIQRRINLYINLKNKEGPPVMDNYYQKEIDKANVELREINNKGLVPQYDEQNIDAALLKLQMGNCNGFILYLNAQDNLSIIFEKAAVDIIEISLSVKSVLNVEYFWSDEEEDAPLNKFYGLGFNNNPQNDKLVYSYNFEGTNNAIAVKILLSRIIYDVFTYAEFDTPASLIYF